MRASSVGVSIATRNRWRDVETTLSRIAVHAELRNCPIMVIDDGSEEPVPASLMERFRNVEFHASERSLGAAAQRTRIARLLVTDFILQLDDDSYPIEGSVSEAVLFMRTRPDVAALALNVVMRDQDAPAIDRAEAPYEVDLFIGCGVLLRREMFLKLGGYISSLGYYCEEDHFGAAAFRKGMAICMFPSLVVRHEKSVRARSTGRIAYLKGRNRVLLAIWHYPLRAIPFRLATSLPGTLALVRWRDYPAAVGGFFTGLFDGLRMLRERQPLTYRQYLKWRALPSCYFPRDTAFRPIEEPGKSADPRVNGASDTGGRIRVFLLCCGLGHIDSGHESFARECFDAISCEPSIEIMLFKGGGRPRRREVRLPNIARKRPLGKIIGRLINKSPYLVEQVTFTVSLLPYLLIQRPDIVYLSDGSVGRLLWCWKKATGAKFKLLLSNSGPLNPPFPRWDHIQQVTPVDLNVALQVGEPPERQSLVPHGIKIPRALPRPVGSERASLRVALKLPPNRPLVLSVGLVDKSRKRMDYVIDEIAGLPEGRPFLVMLGQTDAETPQVAELARRLLGEEEYALRTAPQEDVAQYYRSADMFVLGSLHEGFGRVVIEAMSHGLRCLVHDTEIMHYLLGEFGYFGNFAVPGSLAHCMRLAMSEEPAANRLAQQRVAYERFSWDQLRPAYVKMFRGCLRAPCTGQPQPTGS
jgi:1,2-diacylglycerol 3-alpha-glucosyltransferase